MTKVKKMEILIKSEGDAWLTFHAFKYWLQISDNHTTELAAWACVYASSCLWVPIHHN